MPLRSQPLRRTGRVVVLGVALAILTSHVQATAERPGRFIQENGDAVIAALKTRRTEFIANPDSLHRFVRAEFAEAFDRTYAARLVLGADTTASEAELRAFSDALVDNLMDRYGNSLLKMQTRLNVRVVSEQPLRDGTIIKVKSVVERRNGSPVSVDYLFHEKGGHWQVFDVIIEGISFVQTFHFVIGNQLRTESLAKLTSDLRSGALVLGSAIPAVPLGTSQ